MYDDVGGYEAIEKLVDDFYRIMSTDPKAKECFATHSGKDLQETADKLKTFLSGWLGGPQLYLEKYGHPRLRMRHMPFTIGVKEAHQWLYCMDEALKLSPMPDATKRQVFGAFIKVAEMLINQDARENRD